MNEFTKEELETIVVDYTNFVEEFEGHLNEQMRDFYTKIIMKAHDMIDSINCVESEKCNPEHDCGDIPEGWCLYCPNHIILE